MIRHSIILLSLFLVTIGSNCKAGPISCEEAKQKALKYMSKIRPGTTAVNLMEAPFKSTYDTCDTSTQVKERTIVEVPAYYVFKATGGSNQGFIIISGDDCYNDVIGYSDCGTIDDSAPMPDALTSILDAYTERVRSGSHVVRREEANETETNAVVGPLLTSQWGQSAPYNLLCPNTGRVNAPVGCVATAMSQIMYYWQWPVKGVGYMSYSTPYGTLSADFASHEYKWDILSDRMTNSSPEDAKTNVAQLCYDCGVSIKMAYESGGSGASTDAVITSLYSYFSYRPSTMRYYYRECVNSQDEWEGILKRELDTQRPIIMRATSDDYGHAFVIDGYDTAGYFHVNWGWDGNYDGFFDMSLMNPSGYKYTQHQAVIVGIQPNYEGISEKRMQAPVYLVDSLTTTWKQRKLTQFFSVTVGQIYNNRSEGRSYTLGVGLYDSRGRFIADVSQASDSKTVYWAGFYGSNSFGTISCKLTPEVIEQCNDGNYVLRLMACEAGYDEWMWPDVVGGSDNNRIPLYIHDGVMEFNTYGPELLPEDTTGDGLVDTQDVLQVYTSIEQGTSDDINDVNGDNTIDTQDVITIYEYITSH